MNRNQMIKNLQNGYCKVTFTKKNGEERVMNCTLMPSVLKEYFTKKELDNYPMNENTITVFDNDEKNWRCFRVDSVKSFEK